MNHEIPRVVNAVIGGQRGDEGKGKITDDLAQDPNTTHVVRYSGADNAGHTLYLDGKDYDVHALPSGILHAHVMNVVGNGVLVNPHHTALEVERFRRYGVHIEEDNLAVSSIASMILPHHIMLDQLREAGAGRQGSTCRGVAYASADRSLRESALVEQLSTLSGRNELSDMIEDKIDTVNMLAKEAGHEQLVRNNVIGATIYWMRQARKIVPFISDTTSMLREAVLNGNGIVAEGAQAMSLDVNYGQFPSVSSTNTGVAGILSGMGVPHSSINEVHMVAKLIRSHVGGGPFITEETEDQELIDRLVGSRKDVDGEWGTSTGRKRRVGYFDLPELRTAAHLNDADTLVLTKLDLVPRFGDSVKIATHYDSPDGVLTYAPVGSEEQLRRCTPIYKEFPLWQRDISDVREFKDLPKKAKQLVTFIEEQVGIEVRYIGNGPSREQLIKR